MDRAGLIELIKAKGPFIGPRGGKWADPKFTIPYKEGGERKPAKGKEEKPEAPAKGEEEKPKVPAEGEAEQPKSPTAHGEKVKGDKYQVHTRPSGRPVYGNKEIHEHLNAGGGHHNIGEHQDHESDESRELELYAENNEESYKRSQAYKTTLATKIVNGKDFDNNRAQHLFRSLIDEQAKHYDSEFGEGSMSGLSSRDKDVLAHRMFHELITEVKNGEWDHVKTKKTSKQEETSGERIAYASFAPSDMPDEEEEGEGEKQKKKTKGVSGKKVGLDQDEGETKKSLTDLVKEKIMSKAGPYIGPRGGKYKDPQRKIPWKEGGDKKGSSQKKSGSNESAVKEISSKIDYKKLEEDFHVSTIKGIIKRISDIGRAVDDGRDLTDDEANRLKIMSKAPLDEGVREQINREGGEGKKVWDLINGVSKKILSDSKKKINKSLTDFIKEKIIEKSVEKIAS